MSTTATRVIVDRPRSRHGRALLPQAHEPEQPDAAGQEGAGRRETLAGYGFLIPWLIGFFGLTIIPMVYSLYLSFTSYNIFQPPKWIGLDNYIRMFTDDPAFMQSAQITLIYVLVGTPITLAAALAVAMLLNYRDKGAGFFRSSFYAPSLIGGVGVGRDRVAGDVRQRRPGRQLAELLRHRPGRLGRQPRPGAAGDDPAGDLAVRRHMVIFLAGLKQIPKELYEAAEMDGAGAVPPVPRGDHPAAVAGDLLQPAARA